MPVYTLPPDTRAVGTGNPPADVNAHTDALTAMGATFNVLNAAQGGGADPTGVADSSAAFQAAITAATGTGSQVPGEVLIPPGTYKVSGLHITGPVRIRGLGPANGYNSAVTGNVSTLPAVTLNCSASTYLFNMPAQGYLWGGLEMSGLNINFTGTGDVFNSVNFADSAFRDLTVTLTTGGSHVMTCTGSNSVLNVIYERCTFVTTAATRTAPMFSIYSSIGAGISNNTFLKCKFSNAGQDNTQFMVEFGCTGSGAAYHVADNFIDCWFEHPFGGVYKSLSGSNCKVDGCITWDIQGGSPLIGNSMYYFGAYPGNSGSQGVRVISCGRNLNGPDGTSTNKWDVECESTTSNVIVEGFQTTPLTTSTTYNVYFNFHGCNDVVLINNQSPQGATVNGNSTTVITNPSPTQVTISAGVVSPAAQGSFLPADAGMLAWNYDPADINATAYLPASGTVQVLRIPVRSAISVTNVLLYQQALGTGFTASQCFAGLYTSAGAQIGITADQSGVWNSGTDVLKTMPLVGGPFLVQPGFVFLLFLQNGSANWSLGRKQSNFASASNTNLAVAASRWATGAAAQTALPASFTPSSYLTATATEVWGALS